MLLRSGGFEVFPEADQPPFPHGSGANPGSQQNIRTLQIVS